MTTKPAKPKKAKRLANGKKKLPHLVETACPVQDNGQPKPESDGPVDPDADSGKPTQAEALLQSAAAATLFHAPDRTAYATVPLSDSEGVNGPRATWAIRSRDFRLWLGSRHFKATGKAARAQTLSDAVAHFEARACHGAPCLDVFCRLGHEPDGTIWLDLGSPQWDAVKITWAGWQVVKHSPVKFRRSGSLQPLPHPVAGGSIEELRPFINVRKDDWPLLVAWLLAALRPHGPYPALCLHGEQGSAKSTTARVLRTLLDPNTAPLRSEPRDARDLIIAAKNSWVQAYDNLSQLPPWLSDALCRLSTGGGTVTRELYTNDGEFVCEAQRPIILTGIEEVTTRSDLLDRAIVLDLPSLKSYRTEKDFWASFKQAKPRILGALLNAVAGAVKQLPSVQPLQGLRMADFAAWATAAESALGWINGTFRTAYTGNRDSANELALETTPLYSPLCVLMNNCKEWQGTPSALLTELAGLVGETVARSASWPKKPQNLSGQLKRLAPNLRRAGIQVDLGVRAGDKKGSRQIRITKLPTACNQAPEAPEASDVGEEGGLSDAPPADSDAAEGSTDAPLPEANTSESIPF